MALITLNNRSINRTDTASAGQVWTATSATAADFQTGGKVLQVINAAHASAASSIIFIFFISLSIIFKYSLTILFHSNLVT